MKKQLKYGLETDEDVLDRFTDVTNRSTRQTLMLYELVNKDFCKMVELEEKIKNNYLFYCPATEEEVKKVLEMGYGEYKFKIM